MRSELFRIPIEIAGVPFLGFGVLLLAWLVGSAGYIAWLIRRGDRDGAWAQLPVIGVMAAVLLFIPKIFPEGLPVRGYGVMLVLASLTGLAMAVHRARQRGLNPDVIFSLAFGMFICGILGARLFYVIEYWNDFVAAGGVSGALRKAVQFTEGGLVVYGSLIGATAAFVVFVTRRKLPPLAMADLIAPSLVAGLALGRIGCLLNGCCYGGVCDLPWAVTFPQESPAYSDQAAGGEMHGFRWETHPKTGAATITRVLTQPKQGTLEPGDVIIGIDGQPLDSAKQLPQLLFANYYAKRPVQLSIETTSGERKEVAFAPAAVRPRSLPVHPTQIYSTVNAALLACVLWLFYPLRTRDGQVTALMLTLYPIARFLLEIIRTDESPIFGTGLSISQNVSLLILVGVAALWVYLWSRPSNIQPLAAA